MAENSSEYPEHKVSSGSKSLIILSLFLVACVPANLWRDVSSAATGDTSMGALMAFLTLLAWFPLLIASIVYGIKAITNKDGKAKGIISLSLLAVLVGLSAILS